MIESLKIRNIATFDPEIGIQLNGLKKVNFIYGANGSGKTTISNFLHDSGDYRFNDCSLVWQNDQEVKTLVYNKEFRERNFGKGKLAGIFTLGEATKEQKKEIEEKTEKLKTIKEDGRKKRESLNGQIQKRKNLENDFKKYCWDRIYKKHKVEFKEAFVGSMKSGDLFMNRLIKEFENNSESLKSLDEIRKNAATIFGEVPVNIAPIANIEFERIKEIELLPIWKKIIIGKANVDIAKLIDKLNINDWVNQGREYIQDNNTCPFCQKETIDKKFREQLENFFDETYLNDIKSIKQLKQEYDGLVLNLENELNALELTQKNTKGYKLNLDKFTPYLKTFSSQVKSNSEILNSKIKEPSRSFELVLQNSQLELISDLIKDANVEIKKHNDIVLDYKNQRDKLINSIWKYLIEEYKVEIAKYSSDNKNIEKGIHGIDSQLKSKIKEHNELNEEIKKLSKNVTSIQPTIDEINRLLKSYDFQNFSIVPANEEGFYQIQREDGSIAELTLSEGEVTFITFLYYLHLAKGGTTEENVTDERILVIDDPISSLDSNVLFVVSTLIKEIIKEIKLDKGNIRQVILLTHNVYFHKEVSFEGLNRKGEKSLFWILRKVDNSTTIQAYLEQNPIQSSYELLWREIREWEKNSGTTIQNTMRRIIENYFNILGSKRDDTIISCFETNEEREICRSLLSWINEGSHTLPDDLYIEIPDGTIEKYLKVFREIFIHTRNEGHYNMMMGIEEEIHKELELEEA